MISAAFQSPPRARQKTRAGRVGESDGVLPERGAGLGRAVEQEPGVEPAAEELGRLRAGALDEGERLLEGPDLEQPVDPRHQHRIARSGARRRVGLGEQQPVEERARLGHALVGMVEDEVAHLLPRVPSPQSARAKPVRSGGSRPTASRRMSPSGVTVMASPPRGARIDLERLGGGGVPSSSMLCESQGMALRGSAASPGRGRRRRHRGHEAREARRPPGHFASTGMVTSRCGAGRSEKIASAKQPDHGDEDEIENNPEDQPHPVPLCPCRLDAAS